MNYLHRYQEFKFRCPVFMAQFYFLIAFQVFVFVVFICLAPYLLKFLISRIMRHRLSKRKKDV